MAETPKVTVDGILMAGHKGPAVEVPFDPAAEWGTAQAALWPGRHGYPVEVSLNGVRFRSAIVSRMRRFFVLVDESIASRAGSAIGKRVRFTVWPDNGVGPKATQTANGKASTPVERVTKAEQGRSRGKGTNLRKKRPGRPRG